VYRENDQIPPGDAVRSNGVPVMSPRSANSGRRGGFPYFGLYCPKSSVS
jgi:hypothetical protein